MAEAVPNLSSEGGLLVIRARLSLLMHSRAISSARAKLTAASLAAALLLPIGAMAKPGPDGFADLAGKLLPAVVNISSTQTIKPDQGTGKGGPGGPGAPGAPGGPGGGNRLGPDVPQFPPGSPFEEFF